MADNRRAYGIAKGLGIDTADMSPKEVWEAIAKKQGVSVEQAQKQADGTNSKDGRKSAVEKLQELAKARIGKDNSEDDDIEVVEVDLTADIQKQFDKATPEERRKIAFDYIMDNLRDKYPARDGRLISIGKVGAKKIKNTLYEPKIRVIPELAYLIQSGKFDSIRDVEHKIFKQFAYYKVSFRIGDHKYNALLNVGIRENGDSTLYELNKIVEK